MAETLKKKLQEDMKDALRNKDSVRLSAIRLLLADIKKREIDDQIALDDTALLKLISKKIKKCQDASEQFTKASRTELADKENQEIAVLKHYLPEPLSAEAIEIAIKKAIEETNADSIKDMGKLMGHLKPQLEGRADMRIVSMKIKELLNK